MSHTDTITDFQISDIAYRHVDGRELLGRLYRPVQDLPCPLLLEVHGGAWVGNDRLLNARVCRFVASRGIAAFSIDFRMPPAHRYPTAVIDVNFAIRWLKQNAQRLGGRRDWVGGIATSSGAHLLMLNLMRPEHPRYLSGDDGLAERDATLSYAVACWPVLDPMGRYRLMQQRGNRTLLDAHAAFWPDEASMADGNPQYILDRGDARVLPDLLLIQGTHDENLDASMSETFAASFRAAGGTVELAMYEGAPHAFFNRQPDAPHTRDAFERIVSFTMRHTELSHKTSSHVENGQT